MAEIHLWRIEASPDQSVPLADFEKLSQDERARASAFRDAADRNRYVRVRLGLRRILAASLGSTPARIALRAGPHGKPSLASPDRDRLHFNLSHAGDLAVVALSGQAELGVDIEQARSGNLEGRLARRILSPAEWQTFERLPPAERSTGFLRCWTRKEAYLKATGEGLSVPLPTISVTFLDGDLPRLIRVDGRSDAAKRWTLYDLSLADGYVGALCVAARSVELRWFDLTDETALASARSAFLEGRHA